MSDRTTQEPANISGPLSQQPPQHPSTPSAPRSTGHHSVWDPLWLDFKYLGILALLWTLAAGVDQLWLALDHAIPSWDPADHLIGSLNYWWVLHPQQWLTDNLTSGATGSLLERLGHLWTALWTLSSKYPPLLYISTAPFLSLFGRGADQASLVNLLYTAILLVSVYGLGRTLFRAEVGLWAGGLCLLFPQFYSLRAGYFMDYPLTSLVTASLLMLTLWRRSLHPSGSALTTQGQRRKPPNLYSTQHPNRSPNQQQWSLAIGFGVIFGLALLSKQTAVFFLALPLLWTVGERLLGLRHRHWGPLGQLMTSLTLAGLMILPWSQANWIFQISAAFNSNSRSAEIEGDPTWDTLAGWTHYWQALPQAISYPLLIVPIVGLLLALIRTILHFFNDSDRLHFLPQKNPKSKIQNPKSTHSLLWLSLCILSVYVIWTAIANKDSRYIMPWLPLWSILLAYGLLSFPKRWGSVKWFTVGIAGGLMMMNLFPIGGGLGRALTRTLAPGAYHQPYLGDPWPHDQVVEEMINTQPYQIANIGVLPSTPEINQHNFTYIGNRHDFRVYARRMGKDKDSLERDVRSLSWFLSVSAPNLNHHSGKSRRRQKEVVAIIQDSGAFKRQKQWTLPDGSRLNLFRRRKLSVKVTPMDDAIANALYKDSPIRNAVLALLSPRDSNAVPQITPLAVHLDDITVPERIPPGRPVPVTYKWSGSWSMLHDGLVFLTWHRQGRGEGQRENQKEGQREPKPNQFWTHDHNIGLGTLYPQIIQANQTASGSAMGSSVSAGASSGASASIGPGVIDPLMPFRVTERTAMLPPASLRPGKYTLEATYLNRVTGDTYPIEVPSITIKVRPKANPTTVEGLLPELDFVTQLRQAALYLPEGVDGLDQVFNELSRVNLYDPVQVYTTHAEDILKHRLQHNPNNLEDVYGLALAQVLQRDAKGAIAALEQATELDPDNAFTHAELAFVNLYGWRPWAAQKALDRAIELKPDVPEFKTLNIVTALMRGNVWQAWRHYQR